jgi:hypothetical protein
MLMSSSEQKVFRNLSIQFLSASTIAVDFRLHEQARVLAGHGYAPLDLSCIAQLL